MRRSNNRYNYYNLPFDEVFDSDKNEEYLIDESATIEFDDNDMLKDFADEERRAIIENSLDCLNEDQRQVVEMAYFQNMSYSEIAKVRGVKNKSSIYKIMKAAERRMKKYIEETQN